MKKIKIIVDELINKYGTCSPYELAKDLNIYVCTDILPITTRGFYKNLNNKKIIGINSMLSEIAQKIVLCHELGHAVMHPEGSFNCLFEVLKTKEEKEANLFAMHLLSYSSINDIKDYENAIFYQNFTDKDIHNLLIRFSLFEAI